MSGGGGGGAKILPVGPGQSLGGGQGVKPLKAPVILQYTDPIMPPKTYILGTFLSVRCIQIERKNSFNPIQAGGGTMCPLQIFFLLC